MPDSSVLLAHIVSQTRQNIDFLISQNVISKADASILLSKLSDSSVLALANQTQNLALHPTPSTNNNLAPERRDVSPAIIKARALWDYHGLESNDLSFRAGDIIEILTETNADWWTGGLDNKQGLFPSNYVEKINNPPTSSYPEKSSYDLVPSGPLYPSQGAPPYQPVAGYQGPPPPSNQGAVHGSYSGQSPPQQVAYNLYTTAPATPVQPSPQAPQKGKFGGGLGSTLAHSAVGGVGFGAASAVGSGLVNAIF